MAKKKIREYSSKILGRKGEIVSGLPSDLVDYLHTFCESERNVLIVHIVWNNISTLTELRSRTEYQYKDGMTYRKIIKGAGKDRMICRCREHTNYILGNSFRGKKRPEHGAKVQATLKRVNQKENWSQKRKDHAKNMNTPEWKRKVLKGKGLRIEKASDDKICEMYSDFLSSNRKSPEYKANRVRNFISNSGEYSHIFDTTLLADMPLEEAYRIANSIQSTKSMMNPNNNMGKFKKILTETASFKFYQGSREVLAFRSSWEEKFAHLMEEWQIPWDFESIIIRKSNGIYTPDFWVNISGEQCLIELKGFLRGCLGINRTIPKINAVKNTSYSFVFLDRLPEHKKEILERVNMRVFEKTHEKEDIQSARGFGIGLSRADVIKKINTGDVFVHDGFFLSVHSQKDEELKTFLIVSDKCVSEIIYKFNKDESIQEFSNPEMHNINIQYFEEQKGDALDAFKNYKK